MASPEIASKLSPAIRVLVARGDALAVIAAIESVPAWNEDPTLLVTWAEASLRSAIEIHVDDVEEIAGAILVMLGAASPDAIPAELLDRVRGLAKVARDDRRRSRESAKVPPGQLTYDQVSRQAHQLSKSELPADLLRAAELFEELAKRSGLNDGSGYGHRCSATFRRFDAGDRSDAMRRGLEQIAAMTSKPATQVPWTVSFAYYRLLEDAKDDAARFARVWLEARAHPVIRNEGKKHAFPAALPVQDKLLPIALDLGLMDVARELALLIRARKRLTRAIAVLLERVPMPSG